MTNRFNCDFDVNRLHRRDQTPVRRHAGRFSFLSVPRGTNSHEGSIERLFELRAGVRTRQEAVMSAVAHRTNEQVEHVAPAIPRQRRRVPAAPPARRRVAGVPRVVPQVACAPRRLRLPFSGMVALAGAACMAVLGLGMLSGAGAASVPDRTAVVRVEPGENLWELAGRVAPGSDASAVVDRIRELNGGLAGGVTPGQPLTVPSE